MPVLEKDTEAKVKLWCEDRHIIYVKVKFSDNGYPDRLMVFPNGIHVWWEAKKEGEEPETLQLYRIWALNQRGVIAFWTDNYDDTILVLQAVLDTPFVPEESDSAFAFASIRRAISRSRTWKNQYLSSGLQNFKREGPSE